MTVLQTWDLCGWTRILIGLVSTTGAFDRLRHRGWAPNRLLWVVEPACIGPHEANMLLGGWGFAFRRSTFCWCSRWPTMPWRQLAGVLDVVCKKDSWVVNSFYFCLIVQSTNKKHKIIKLFNQPNAHSPLSCLSSSYLLFTLVSSGKTLTNIE